MPDGLMVREPEIRRVENQVVAANLHRARRELLRRKRPPSLSVARHVERLDVFPARRPGSELLGVALKVTVANGCCGEGWVHANVRLRDERSVCGCESFLLTERLQARRCEPDLGHLHRSRVGGKKKGDLLLDWNVHRIPCDRRAPGSFHRWSRRELDRLLLHGSSSAGETGRL